jgi:hypothetical protein
MTPESVFCEMSMGAGQLAGVFAQTNIRQSISIHENENVAALFKARVTRVQTKPSPALLDVVWGSVLGLTSINPATHLSAAIGLCMDDRVKHLVQLAVQGNSVRMLIFRLISYNEGIRFLQDIGLLNKNYPLKNGMDSLVRTFACNNGMGSVVYILVPLTPAKRQAVLAKDNANDTAVTLPHYRYTFHDLPTLIRKSPVAHGWHIPTVWGRAMRSNTPFAILKSWWLLMLCVKRRFHYKVAARVNDVLREVCGEWLCHSNQQVNYRCALTHMSDGW